MPGSPHSPYASGFGQVNLQITPFEFDTISRVDCFIDIVIIHFDKSKSPGLTCVSIIDQLDREHITMRRKQVPQLVRRRFKEIFPTYIDFIFIANLRVGIPILDHSGPFQVSDCFSSLPRGRVWAAPTTVRTAGAASPTFRSIVEEIQH